MGKKMPSLGRKVKYLTRNIAPNKANSLSRQVHIKQVICGEVVKIRNTFSRDEPKRKIHPGTSLFLYKSLWRVIRTTF